SQGSLATAAGPAALYASTPGSFQGVPFTGTVKPIGVWGKVLSPSEMTTLYNSGTPLTYAGLSGSLTTGLVSYYDMASGSLGVDAKGANTFKNANPAAPSGLSASSSVATVQAGGPPTISVNGGAAVPLSSNVWDYDNHGLPYVYYPLAAG